MFESLIEDIKREFPDFKMVKKPDSWLMRWISTFLWFITFGSQKTFMSNYVTTIGHTVYVPEDWETWSLFSRVEIMRHERIHMKQQAKYGRILFSFLYVFPFLPLFFAYGRAKFELAAYTETIRAKIELRGPLSVQTDEFKNWLVSQFTTGAYGWMWIHKPTVTRWVEEAITQQLALDRLTRKGN